MRMIFSVIGLLLVVAVVGALAKRQLSALGPAPAGAPGVTATPGSPPGTPPAVHSQRLQQQFKQAVEQGQQPRPLRDDQ